MLDLKVQVAREPVIEEGLINVASGSQLKVDPALVAIVVVDVHHDVVALTHPGKPSGLGESPGEPVDNGAQDAKDRQGYGHVNGITNNETHQVGILPSLNAILHGGYLEIKRKQQGSSQEKV